MHSWVSALLGVWHVLYHGVTVHRQAPDTVRKQLRRAIAPSCSRRLCVGTLGADTASRWSKAGRIDHPAPRCFQSLGRPNVQGRQAACPIAPSLPITLADCGQARAGTQPESCQLHQGLRHQVVLGSAPHESSRGTTGEGRVRQCVRLCGSGSAQCRLGS